VCFLILIEILHEYAIYLFIEFINPLYDYGDEIPYHDHVFVGDDGYDHSHSIIYDYDHDCDHYHGCDHDHDHVRDHGYIDVHVFHFVFNFLSSFFIIFPF